MYVLEVVVNCDFGIYCFCTSSFNDFCTSCCSYWYWCTYGQVHTGEQKSRGCSNLKWRHFRPNLAVLMMTVEDDKYIHAFGSLGCASWWLYSCSLCFVDWCEQILLQFYILVMELAYVLSDALHGLHQHTYINIGAHYEVLILDFRGQSFSQVSPLPSRQSFKVHPVYCVA